VLHHTGAPPLPQLREKICFFPQKISPTPKNIFISNFWPLFGELGDSGIAAEFGAVEGRSGASPLVYF
jgi:hypothetical protein